MTVTITFPEPAERLMSNDKLHWAVRARRVRVWRQMARVAAHQPRTDRVPLPLSPCYVRVTFPVKVNRRRDSDGAAPTVKAIVDGLVDAGCWPDDTPEWVETLGSRFAKGATEVVVELIPRGEEAA
jgi:hypothetical protein